MGYWADVVHITSRNGNIDAMAKVVPFGEDEYRLPSIRSKFGHYDYELFEYGWDGDGTRGFFHVYKYVVSHDGDYYFVYFSPSDFSIYRNRIAEAIKKKLGFEPDEIFYWGEEHWEG